ncbi:phosphotransferase enzyme family protein [Kribbella sp. NPDC058245]|uniref:phosphotransferase enzyme family protein n=1 Tax=Kribbella sp. NPDC058245 TaxID=3346399 RepID=UPI0036E9BE17
MLAEPPVDREALLTAISTSYGVSGELTFIPLGWGSVCYRLDERYFVKLWTTPDDATNALIRFPLVAQLRGSGFRVPYAIPTGTGELSITTSDGVVALFPLLPGRSPEEWTVPLLHELGRVLARLHSVVPTSTLLREDFAVPHQPQRERLLRLQSTVRRLPEQMVVCHTDLHGGNLLVDDSGQLSLLDWEGARWAPPECELALLLQAEQPVDARQLKHVLETYPADVPLHLDLFAFFLLRRYVADYSARAWRLKQSGLTAADEAEAREGMVTWGSAQWEALDRTLELVRDVLRMRE